MEIRGVAELEHRLAQIAREAPQLVARALYEEALLIEGVSKERTPVDTGALRASHHVTEPEVSGDEVSVAIQVGGPAADYAVIVHENLDVHHPVGQAKFLESALLDVGSTLAQRLASRINLERL